MSSITQTISSYTGGISQQPDELKLPGQVSKAKNVYPDLVNGLTKRPGGKLIKSLSDGSLAINVLVIVFLGPEIISLSYNSK